ncbi:hypothetical protein BU26DRAFT_293087 [Trematosphaeria pertusa]|uniref:Uncharacterized protein n=1 Tax=Trematosphaeria pertusa TaxID=390896 RepID=A0A6A6IJB0_9PLEO|nr:uncharacterized protein BU26DRAFT_293087 [Trematosphaeria pertusa]KAF2249962.1 hypothetical protein BU26DRAFT_293087 [Trematosphaeria pertusa]
MEALAKKREEGMHRSQKKATPPDVSTTSAAYSTRWTDSQGEQANTWGREFCTPGRVVCLRQPIRRQLAATTSEVRKTLQYFSCRSLDCDVGILIAPDYSARVMPRNFWLSTPRNYWDRAPGTFTPFALC